MIERATIVTSGKLHERKRVICAPDDSSFTRKMPTKRWPRNGPSPLNPKAACIGVRLLRSAPDGIDQTAGSPYDHQWNVASRVALNVRVPDQNLPRAPKSRFADDRKQKPGSQPAVRRGPGPARLATREERLSIYRQPGLQVHADEGRHGIPDERHVHCSRSHAA